MVRAAPAGQLTSRGHVPTASGVRFGLATPEHDAPLRRLLRENAMPGSISLTMEREPNFFAAAGVEGPEHQTIVAVENDRVVAAGNISARQRFINGQAMRVGYLGALRLDASCRGHASILRRGYEAFRKLHEQLGPPIYLTSIVADNLSARTKRWPEASRTRSPDCPRCKGTIGRNRRTAESRPPEIPVRAGLVGGRASSR